MKKLFILSSIALVSIGTSFSQEFKDVDKSPLDVAYYPTNATKRVFAKTATEKKALEPKIRVLYSRPQKKGRVIFGNLVEYGTAWRLGANECTEIHFMTNVIFGGKPLKAGRYLMMVTPKEKEWKVTLNSITDQWGVYGYDSKYDVASVTVPVQKSEEDIESLSIALYEKSSNLVHIKIGWDKTIVEVPVSLK